ncbi:hypothetical protein [Shewanella japonica]|uniref:hypothetical protein n=1 Tax=Shewanella japonica TaxID=93973 RepID=UPI000E715852|nr:hypothetical protein [Shewanella japonica]
MSLLKNVCIGLLVALMFTGCAVDKRPDSYKPAINISPSIAAHASLLSKDQALQHALERRNLVISRTGEVLPLNQNVCQSALYYQISDRPLPSYIGQHQDLLSGFVLKVIYSDEQWKVVNPERELMPLNDFYEDFSDTFSAQDQLIFQPSANTTNAQLKQLMQVVSQVFEQHANSFIVSASQAASVKTAGFQAITTKANSQQRFIRSSSHGVTQIQVNDSFGDSETLAIIFESDPLTACMKTNTNLVNDPVNDELKPPLKIDQQLLVATLPKDADFNQLAEQEALFSEGVYLNIWGDKKPYGDNNKLIADRCIKPESHLLAECSSRIGDGNTKTVNGRAILRRVNNEK